MTMKISRRVKNCLMSAQSLFMHSIHRQRSIVHSAPDLIFHELEQCGLSRWNCGESLCHMSHRLNELKGFVHAQILIEKFISAGNMLTKWAEFTVHIGWSQIWQRTNSRHSYPWMLNKQTGDHAFPVQPQLTCKIIKCLPMILFR